LVICFQTKRVCAERGRGRAMALLQLCKVHIPVCNSTNSPIALLLDNNGANNSSQSAHLTAFSNSASCCHHGVDVRLFASSSSPSNRRGAAAGSLLQVLFLLSPPQNCSAETMFFFVAVANFFFFFFVFSFASPLRLFVAGNSFRHFARRRRCPAFFWIDGSARSQSSCHTPPVHFFYC
jgi:hypothetical protein